MRPSCEQHRDFFAECLSGAQGSLLDRCITHAYRDMNRTLQGIGQIKDKRRAASICDEGKELVRRHVIALAAKAAPETAPELHSHFDAWHSAACLELISFYNKALSGLTPARTHFGQAQKWINMTIKYCWVCWDGLPEGLGPWYPAAHVPVDELILSVVVEYGAVPDRPCSVWSRWDDEQEYLTFQKKLREIAMKNHTSPLELEFEWWLDRHRRAASNLRG
jgi:hypothetical protein